MLADNIANADTPGYKAVDIPFEATLGAQLLTDQNTSLLIDSSSPKYRSASKVGLDGNDVSLDSERVEAAKNGEEMIGATTFLHQSTTDFIMALRPNPGGI